MKKIIAMGFCVGLVGCADNKIDRYLRTLDKLPADDASLVEGAVSAPFSSGDYSCQTHDVNETKQIDEIVAFAANSNALYPGAILRGDSVYSGLFTETVFERQPATFSISLPGIAAPSAQMESPSLSEFRTKLNGILSAELTGATPANIFSEIEEVHSQEQFQLAVSADASWGGLPIQISGDFNFNDQNKRSRFLVRFVQSFYTVDLDSPRSASDFFGSSVTVNDIESQFNDGNPPVYVSSITFGRTVLFSFESEFSSTEVSSALDVAFNGGIGNVNVEISLSDQEILDRTKITAYILGGSGADAVQAITGFDALLAFIQQGGNFSLDNPGAPIAYKLNHLADNSPARLSLTNDYQINDCARVNQKLLSELKSIECSQTDDEGGGAGDELELYGVVTASAKNSATLLDLARTQFINVAQGQNQTLINGQGIINVNPQAGNAVQFSIDLLEKDDSSSDDTLAGSLSAPFELGWRGNFTVSLPAGSTQCVAHMALRPI